MSWKQGERGREVMSIRSIESRDTLQRLVNMKRGNQSKLWLILVVSCFILSLLKVIIEVISVLIEKAYLSQSAPIGVRNG